MIRTSIFAQRRARTEAQWEDWLRSLKEGDRVLYQSFQPKESLCLGSLYERWQFCEGRYYGTFVVLDGNRHPLKGGIAVHHNSDHPHGKVFPSRIVPWSKDMVSTKSKIVDAHAPIFEPAWGPDRCFALDRPKKGGMTRRAAASKHFKHSYFLPTNDGLLLIAFGERDSVVAQLKELNGFDFCYSEHLVD